MDGRGEPQWQPISRLPFMLDHAASGVGLAREHLELLEQARGAYRLNNADLARIVRTWTQTRTDLVELFAEQGRCWQALDLGATRRRDVERYVALVAEETELVERILALADELKAWTIEALMAKSDEQIGLEALFGQHRP